MPRVSVLMPVYNTKEEYLREAIESILNQTYQNFEFLILNDASTDPSVEKVVKSYSDSKIVYLNNEKNRGISLSRNKLLDLAKGEYLAVMDHDDLSLPERFSKQVAFLDNNPKVGVVGCWSEELPKNKLNAPAAHNDEIELELMFSCAIIHPASMIRKSVLLDNNISYEDKFSPSEDYALWCRLIGKTKFANIAEVLFKYRIHESNTFKTQNNKMKSKGLAIWSFVRSQHSALWAEAQMRSTKIYRFKLFGFIPFLEVKSRDNKTECFLFGFIPLLSYKYRHTHKK